MEFFSETVQGRKFMNDIFRAREGWCGGCQQRILYEEQIHFEWRKKCSYFKTNKMNEYISSSPRSQGMLMEFFRLSWRHYYHYKPGNVKNGIVYCIVSESVGATEDY